MKAVWNGKVIADAPKDEVVCIEEYWYFPPTSVNKGFLRRSETPYESPWKGECQYYDVGWGAHWNKDAAFCYQTPLPDAFDKVGKDFTGFMAFWKGIQIVDD